MTISAAELAALAEGRRRAEANGHDMEPPRQGLSILTLACRRCPADVALLKGDVSLRLSGDALKRPCSSALPVVSSTAEVHPCGSTST